ncbi:MAG TPA: HTH domain-containing protein, partial [Anaerolineaceae bacterium]|nr:HTH domain-containing protein [Anaerolineaceae bacterium]
MTISKEIQLISFLLNQGSWVTTSVISDYLELSPRSVSTYISELNKKYDGLILSSNKGYRILKDKACAILNAISTRRIPSNYEERKKYILEKILLSQQFPTIDFLSDRLCVSPSTLQNEISKLRSELSDFHLHLRIKNNKLSIIGLDRDKRRLVLDLINEELENSSFSLESIQDLFVTTDLKRIKKIVTNALKNNEYFLDEYSLLNYILHIAVFIELKGNNYIANAKDHNALRINFRKVTSPHVCKIIEEIFSEIKLAYGGDFTIEDFSEVSLSMMTSAVSNNLGKLHMDQLEELVGREIEKLLFEIVRSVRSTYSIDLKEDGFMIRFAFHLKNVIKRVENNIKLRNSEFKSIKSDFPLIYVIAVFISNIINKKTNH